MSHNPVDSPSQSDLSVVFAFLVAVALFIFAIMQFCNTMPIER